MNEPLSLNWRGVTFTLNALLLARETLENGFWPSSRYDSEEEDQYLDNNIMREEYAEDASFVDRRRDRLTSSFHVVHDL